MLLGVLVLLGLVGGLTNKVIKTEHSLKIAYEQSEALTIELHSAVSELSLAKAEVKASKRYLKKAARNPDGTVALDGNGNPIFETDESSNSSASSSASSSATGASASASSTKRHGLGTSEEIGKHEERPAVKKWQVMAGQQVWGGRSRLYGGGYRQSLWLVEASVWGMGNKGMGLGGVSLAF